MSSPAATTDRPTYHLVIIGAVLPAIFTILNTRLQAERTVVPFLGALVLEVGLLGLLCAKLIRPLWFACTIYGWSWLVMDIPVIALAIQDQWPWVLIYDDTLPAALLAGQLGLVIIWLILGQARWTMRWPAALVLATAAFVPLIWHRMQPTEFLIMLSLQMALLAMVCGILSLAGFRLVRQHSDDADPGRANQHQVRLARQSQFQVRDVLVWMTALALALAAARAAGYWPALVEAWQQALNGLSSSGVWAVLLPTPRTAMFSALVLVIAMFTALRPGRNWLRCVIFLSCTLAIALGCSLLDFHSQTRTWLSPSPWDPQYWQFFWYREWPLISWLTLSGGMIYAALLFPRTLGYRLAREKTIADPTRR